MQASQGAAQGARTLTMAQAISEAIGQEMERDPRVFVMGEDIGKYGGIFSATTGLLDRFGPDRIMDTPISETAFIGAALGAGRLSSCPTGRLQVYGVAAPPPPDPPVMAGEYDGHRARVERLLQLVHQ